MLSAAAQTILKSCVGHVDCFNERPLTGPGRLTAPLHLLHVAPVLAAAALDVAFRTTGEPVRRCVVCLCMCLLADA